MSSLDARINSLDIGLFDYVESQTAPDDKRSLLALQAATRAAGPYVYLEIGSFLGGSLQPHVVDPLCRRIISIDPRPVHQPDSRPEHSGGVTYGDLSAEHMLSLLAEVPGADLDKVTTIEAGTEAIDPRSLGDAPTLCFIDGEHTSPAALQDAIFCRQANPAATIAFHDRTAVRGALGAFLGVYGGYAYQVPRVVFVVEPEPVLLTRSSALRGLVQRDRMWRFVNRTRLAAPLMTSVALARG